MRSMDVNDSASLSSLTLSLLVFLFLLLSLHSNLSLSLSLCVSDEVSMEALAERISLGFESRLATRDL